MSFIYSRALVEESLQASCLAVDAFAPLSVIPTPKPFLLPGRTMEPLHRSRFGMTFEPLTDDLGAELLTSWLADFHAKTSVSQEVATDSTESAPDCGPKWRGSFAKYDHAESKWKTHQCSLLGGLGEFSETWPRWGSMRNGESYLRQTWTPPTFGSESGYPAIWPTPTVCGNYNRKGASKSSGDGLATAVKMWPTPCASASKGSSPAALFRKTGRSRASDRIDHAVMASDGGQLNPEWVEWLMGWPIGHTGLEPLAMDRLAEWRLQHGACLEAA